MRFDLNKFFVFFAAQTVFENGNVVEKPYAYPSTNPKDAIKEIKFIRVECKEHHKVACEWEPEGERKYDGFIFETSDGMRGLNQFPTASYGQMDDSADGTLSFLEAYFEKFERDFDKVLEADVYLSYFLFTRHMDNLERAIFQFGPEGESNDDEYYAKLLERKKILCDALAEQLSLGIRFEPFSVTANDGKVIAPKGMFRSELYELNK